VLLFALFVVLVATAVFLYYLGYGLRTARRDMPGFLADVDVKLGELEQNTYDASAGMLGRPIRALSTWQGLKAGTRVLLGRDYRPALRATKPVAELPSGESPPL
jgi:hypothetical protein